MNEEKPYLPTIEDIESGRVQIILPKKKKRVKKRFTSKEQIIAKIDKFTAKAKRQRKLQSEAYAAANTIRRDAMRTDDTTLLAEAVKKDNIGDGWGRKADRLEKDVLKELSQKLAEFQTEVIPGMLPDNSVEAPE